ncbi:MAG TPA: glycosyltransferase [Bryobacteraceae bacterium]|nr:glycosyltransferase [Bryobacteraceae bacterium]
MPLQRKRQSSYSDTQTIEEAPQAVPEPVEPPPGPRVTAIIVAYNQASQLRRCLDALGRSQDRQTLEILVMDNGSFDETRMIDADYPEVTILRLPKNFGRVRAMNILTRTAKAELLFFLDPRIEVQPDTVSRLAAALEENEQAAAVCPLIIAENGAPVEAFFRLPDTSAFARVWSTGEGLLPQPIDAAGGLQKVEYATFEAMLITKYFVRGLNYLDDRYGEYWADAEVSWQIRRAGRSILVMPSVRVVRHAVGASPRSTAARAALAVDCGGGASSFVSKHSGFLSGLLLRLRFALSALGSALILREPGYNLSRFAGLLSGSKIDGNQSAIL